MIGKEYFHPNKSLIAGMVGPIAGLDGKGELT